MKHIFEHFISGEQAYTQIVAPVCEKYGLTYAEITVLMFLANHPTLDTASDIVKCRHIAKSQVSISVRSLNERGWLTKEYRGINHKSVHLSITDQASDMIKDGHEAQESFGKMLFHGVSEGDMDVMRAVYQKMDQNIQKFLRGEATQDAKS